MTNIFMCLLANLKSFGKITSLLLKNDDYATIIIEDDNFEYFINVTKSPKVEVKNND